MGKELQHIRDPKYLHDLWIAIHGGDPAPDFVATAAFQKATAELIRLLVPNISPQLQKPVIAALGSHAA